MYFRLRSAALVIADVDIEDVSSFASIDPDVMAAGAGIWPLQNA